VPLSGPLDYTRELTIQKELEHKPNEP
jgi:hypothetical protein